MVVQSLAESDKGVLPMEVMGMAEAEAVQGSIIREQVVRALRERYT